MNEEAKRDDTADTTRTRTWVDEVEIAGNQLIDRIQELVRDGNAKRVIIRTSGGEELMTVPLTVGMVAGGLITLSAPLLAALGAVAGLVTRVTLEVVREGADPESARERAEASSPGPSDAPATEPSSRQDARS